MLECGSPININAPLIIAQGQDPKPVVNALCRLLRKQARHEKAFMIVVRDFQPESTELLSAFQSVGFCAVDSLPNTHMKVVWNSINDYHAAMKSYFRSKLLKHLRINHENEISHRVTEDFSDTADILCAQWLTVHNQADELKREVLTPEFFRGFASLPEKCAKVILYYRSNELVGHALLLVDGDLLRWMYIGRKNAGNDSLYFYIGNSVIETAIGLGLKKIEMGVTTYSIKRDLGAAITPVRMALHASNVFINPLVRYFYPLINQLPIFSSKDVFKKSGQ
jgi:predicted N-acyltransferase